MTADHRMRSTAGPHGIGGSPWWVTLLIGAVLLVPSTAVLLLPATFVHAWTPGVVLVAWLIMALGLLGVVGGTINSALCKAFGWWPVPVALAGQWIVAWLAYPMVW